MDGVVGYLDYHDIKGENNSAIGKKYKEQVFLFSGKIYGKKVFKNIILKFSGLNQFDFKHLRNDGFLGFGIPHPAE